MQKTMQTLKRKQYKKQGDRLLKRLDLYERQKQLFYRSLIIQDLAFINQA